MIARASPTFLSAAKPGLDANDKANFRHTIVWRKRLEKLKFLAITARVFPLFSFAESICCMLAASSSELWCCVANGSKINDAVANGGSWPVHDGRTWLWTVDKKIPGPGLGFSRQHHTYMLSRISTIAFELWTYPAVAYPKICRSKVPRFAKSLVNGGGRSW
jgi:hypothetical protein